MRISNNKETDLRLRKSSSILNLTMIVLSLLPISITAHAQQAKARNVIEEVIVTAQKREQSIADVPLSIQALGADKLERERIESLGDLRFVSPSFTFSAATGGGLANSISMRGLGSFSSEGGVQPSVSTVLDGVPLSRSGEFSADLGDIERIEVITGPQGTLFGRNSTAGALNITRKGPSPEFEASIEGSVTDDSERVLKLMLNGPLSDSILGRVNILSKDRDGHIRNLHADHGDAGGDESLAAVAKLAIDFSDAVSMMISADFNDSETGGNPLVTFDTDTLYDPEARYTALGDGDAERGRQIMADPFTINNNSPDFYNFEQWGIVADLTWQLSDNWTLKSLTSARGWEQEFGLDIDSTPASVGNLNSLTANITETENTYGLFAVAVDGTNYSPLGRSGGANSVDYQTQELRLEYGDERMSVVAGGYYQNYHEDGAVAVPVWVRQNPDIPLPPTPFIVSDPYTNDLEQTSWAVFGDVTYDVTDIFQVFAGLRWTDEQATLDHQQRSFVASVYSCENNFCDVDLTVAILNEENNHVTDGEAADWSGRLGGRWTLSDDTNVYTSYSRGFIGIGVNYTRSSTPENAYLNPSVSDAYEVGIKTMLFDSRMQLHGAMFYQIVEELQTTKRVPGSTQTAPINAGNLYTQGFELNGTWLATQSLEIQFGAAFTDAEFRDFELDCYVGQSAEDGCNTNTNIQDMEGQQPPQAPRFKYTLSGNYERQLLDLPMDVTLNANYVWQDETATDLKRHPKLFQEAYGLLNVSAGLRTHSGKYEISLFGRNVTDEFYALRKGHSDPVTGYFQYTVRGAQAYWGVNGKLRF